MRKGRENILETLNVAGQVQFTALKVLVQRRAFLHQQGADDDHRQDGDHQAYQQRQARSQIAPPVQVRQQTALQRGEDDAKDHRPEHRAVERQQDPDEGNGHQGQ
ncbi:hypothetical protein D3C84_688940 [compost metagenome]